MNIEQFARLEELIEQQNTLLRALLAIQVDNALSPSAERPGSRFGGIEHVLSESGTLKNVDIAKVLGKSPQAVGQALTRQKARATPAE